MGKKTDINSEMKELRKKAEKKIDKKITELVQSTHQDYAKILHELGVHQIELEMQNEELRRTQMELEKSHNKYTDLYDFAPIGYFTIDKKGLIVEANLTGCRMLGMERKNLINKPFHHFVTRESQDTFFKHRVDSSVLSELMHTCEIELVDTHGIQFYARLDSIPVMSDNDHIERVRTAVIDITEQRQAQELTRQSEKKYCRLFNTMSEGFALHEIILDENGKPYDYRFLDVNPAFETLTGLDAKDIVGKTVRQVIPEIEQYWIDEYGEVALTGRSKNFERFSKNLGKYYEIFAFRPAQNHFAAIFTDITKRKKDEKAIRIANERLELAQRTTGAGMWDWDIETGKLTWSKQLFDLFGLDPSQSEASFENWASITHPDDRRIASDRIEEAVRNHTQLNSESRIVMPSGEVLWINALGKTTYNKHGKALRMSGICIDITERKRAEEMLRYHAGLVDNISEAVMSMDKDAIIISWNRAAEQMYGWQAEEVIGKSVRQFIKPEYSDDSTAEGVIRQVFERGKWAAEIIQKRKDGSKFNVAASLTVKKNKAGENIGFIAVDRDITKRKCVEAKLRESEEKFRRIVEIAEEGIATHEPDGTITYVNQRMADMLGYLPSELIGRSSLDFLDDEQRQAVIQARESLKEKGSFRMELRLRRKNGSILWTLANLALLRDSDGNFLGFMAMHTDITEIKKKEGELRQKNEDLTRFNKYAVGRELRMIELKKEINNLYEAKGEPPRYKVDFDKKIEKENVKSKSEKL